jgi:FlaA1/EpsC-like NDP-sugar epimerase
MLLAIMKLKDILNNKTVLITGRTGSFWQKFSKIVLEKFPYTISHY